MKKINTDKAPKALGPYSQAILTNDQTLYLSGQLGIDPISGELESGIEAQTKRVLNNINAILEVVNFNKNHVVKTTIFLNNMDDFQIVNSIYEHYFGDHKPARSTIQVAKLPKNGLVEIEVIAKN
ncbi:RidA family protein [Williamsoniiplasma luminosum]|uniref:Reactive intermediate/imine deaminase n=1 Tax=Williamsoniiplasma luminosum TaxID=214888 RepID=A0A2S0NL77_9MOLU|nr:RidA family protein [Williamsoniiplasma luminosum]AVP49766.1 MAG: reactive intermediate/imine deaminase [Williamsoniiplasma luminosum]